MSSYLFKIQMLSWILITMLLVGCAGLEEEYPVVDGRVARYARQEEGKEAEYVYVAAGETLQYYRMERASSDGEPEPPASSPMALKDIYQFQDAIQHMDVDGDFLFLNAGNAGFYIFDLSANPFEPNEIYSGSLPDSDCEINDLDVNHGLVAVSCENSGEPPRPVDAKIYKFAPQSGDLDLKYDALSSVARMKLEIWPLPGDVCETKFPISVALGADNTGLYVGYYHECKTGHLDPVPEKTGGITYIPFNCDINTEECHPSPDEKTFLSGKFTGAPWDMAVRGNDVYIATDYGNHKTVLSRFYKENGSRFLSESTILDLEDYSAVGKYLHIHNNLLIFATEGEHRYVRGKPHTDNPSNIWLFEWDDDLTAIPTFVASASTPNAVTDLSCRDAETASDWVYVTDDQGELHLLRWNGVSEQLVISE